MKNGSKKQKYYLQKQFEKEREEFHKLPIEEQERRKKEVAESYTKRGESIPPELLTY